MYKRLFKYMKPYIWRYILALVLMAIIVGIDILSPLLISFSLKELGQEVINFNKVVMYFVVCLILTLMMYVLQFVQTMLLHYTGQRIVYKIREDVFAHIQSLSHHQFNEIPVGTLVTRDTSDVNVLFQLYTNVIVNLLKNVATIVGVFVAMLLLNVKLALIVLVSLRQFLRTVSLNSLLLPRLQRSIVLSANSTLWILSHGQTRSVT